MNNNNKYTIWTKQTKIHALHLDEMVKSQDRGGEKCLKSGLTPDSANSLVCGFMQNTYILGLDFSIYHVESGSDDSKVPQSNSKQNWE